MRSLLTSLLLLLAIPISVQGAEEFLISYWYGPEPDQQRFTEIAEANFNVAMTGGGIKALDIAQQCGLKVLLMDPRIYHRRASDTGLEERLDAVVEEFGDHPALWGYYVTDEPNASQFEQLATVNRYLLKRDPKHIPFINLFPTYALPEQLGNPTYRDHVASFLQIVRPKLLSYDHYALFKDSIRPDYFENMEIIRQQALQHKVPFNYILLSIPHFAYRTPSEADLRWQVNTALAYGARGIMYFTYDSVRNMPASEAWGDAIIDRQGQRTARYEQVKQINSELKRLAPTLMQLTSLGVYHTPPVPNGAAGIPENNLLKRIAGGPLVIGQFRSQDGQRYMMFVNRSPQESASATIVFSDQVTVEQVDRSTGKPQAVTLQQDDSGSTWKASFEPGQGRLVRIR